MHRQQRWHLFNESPDLLGKFQPTIANKNFTHRPPSAVDFLSRLNESVLASLNPQAAVSQFAGSGLCSLAGAPGSTTEFRANSRRQSHSVAF